VTRRRGAATLGLLGTVFIGGISQAFLWRWGLVRLSTVTGPQFMWVLLTFGVAWLWARGRIGAGMAAGALTGLALISSYYAVQRLADGRHAASAQFFKTGGLAWTLAAVGGGAVMGFFGALAGLDGRERPALKALGITTPALIVGLGPIVWILVESRYLEPSRLVPAVAVFTLAGAAMLSLAVRTCGPAASVRASMVSAGVSATAVVGLLLLQTHGLPYLTF